jgi:hypothetical protein
MENEIYNPVDPVYYNYKVKNNLLDELPKEVTKFNNIYICSYNVTTSEKYPFLRFLLIKSKINDTLYFPQIPIIKNLDNKEFVDFMKIGLYGLMRLNDYDTFNNDVEFNGYYEYNNNLYVFFDITKCAVIINDIYSNNTLWFVLIDEIVNHTKMCNIPINNAVIDLFRFNEDLCFLMDKNGLPYEIPSVGYVGKKENKLHFTYTFGQTKSDKNGFLGPFYYFTNYYIAFKEAFELLDNKLEKIGIIRFALFSGNTKYFENNPNDAFDVSEIKKQRLIDSNLDSTMEKMTMRISDHNGEWSENYDSAYLGIVELDNGDLFEKQTIVLKEYNQQIPLSYHYINQKSDDYLIL